MRIVIARTIEDFSMNIYADGIISGLRNIRPNWEIIDLSPRSFDRSSRSLWTRSLKGYERFWRFPRLVQQQSADIFHVLDHSEAHIVYGLKQRDQAVVATCHDLINYYCKSNIHNSVTVPMLSHQLWIRSIRGLKKCDQVITVSTQTAQDVTNILGIDPERLTVVPNAVDSEFFTLPESQIDNFRNAHQISPNAFCLLNVGSNHPRKNISVILHLIERLKQTNTPIQFWKAGEDFSTDQKTFIQERGLNEHIRYWGKPDKHQLASLYNAASVLIAPSLYEGFGITLIEAMACGLPVITSNTSAMPEVVGDAGILVSPTDLEEMVREVTRLYIHQNQYQTLVKKGLSRAQQFTWTATAEKIAKVYEVIVNPRSNPGASLSLNMEPINR